MYQDDPFPGVSATPMPLNIWTLNVINYVTTKLGKVEDFLTLRTQLVAFLVMNQLQTFVDGNISPLSAHARDAQGYFVTNLVYSTWLRYDQYIHTWLFTTVSQQVLCDIHDLPHSHMI